MLRGTALIDRIVRMDGVVNLSAPGPSFSSDWHTKEEVDSKDFDQSFSLNYWDLEKLKAAVQSYLFVVAHRLFLNLNFLNVPIG